jgi:hypothetical protein
MRFNPDDLGSEMGQKHIGIRSCPHHAEFEYPNPLKRQSIMMSR